MDEELLKRNTDCVYFLASPFTCKKGVECEYRHSATARLNPTDCWYWLSGKCLNPICGFRHPPLDIHTKAPAKAPLPDKSSFPPNKNNVPCYFYINRHCNKGDKCPYLHDPKDILASKQKDFAVVDAPSVDDRMHPDSSDQNAPAELSNDKQPTNVSKAKLPARIEPVQDQPEIFPSVPKRSVKTAKEDPLLQKKHADISDNLGRKDHTRSFPYEYEEASATVSNSLNSSDQCSKEKVDNGVQVEVWESSPGSGFDDLVEGRSESIEETDDEEDMLSYGDSYDRNEGHEDIFKDHSYKDQKEYGGRFLPEKRIHGPVNYSDDEDTFEPVGYSDWDKGGNHSLSQKRKLINVGLAVGGRYDVDLRDHLAKQRIWRSLDARLERPAEKSASRSCSLPSLSKERRGRRQRRNSTQRLHGRFTSSLERGVQVWNSQPTSRRHLRIQKRQKFSSNDQRPMFSRRKQDREVSTAHSFTGPMTLAQITEAKCRTTAASTGHSSHSSSVNFAGPKPLTEILKDKKLRSGGECNTNG